MSRSRRKPYVTDQQKHSDRSKFAKRKAARAVRSLPTGEAPQDGKAYRKESNPWDIRDWSFHNPDDKKSYRK